MPLGCKNAKGKNTQDSEAGYSVKVAATGKKTGVWGFKAHVNTHEDSFIQSGAGRVFGVLKRRHGIIEMLGLKARLM